MKTRMAQVQWENKKLKQDFYGGFSWKGLYKIPSSIRQNNTEINSKDRN